MKVLREKGYIGKEVIFGIRPEDIHDELIVVESYKSSSIKAKINVAELLGSEIMIYSQIDNQDFIARIDARLDIQSGDELTVAFDMNKAHFFDGETEVRIRL